jgi:hypothetical protein
MLKKTYTLCLLGLMGMILMASPVRAQMAGGDFKLNAVLNAGNVDLSWEQPSALTVSYYLVYKAEASAMMAFSNEKANWTLIDSTKDTGYVDTASPGRDTSFVYLVKAFNGSGGSITSNVAVVFVNPFEFHRDHVTITSTPPLNATVDSLYTYKVTAVSDSSNAVLQYRLGEHPALMAMDSTGLISWIPQERGYREVEVSVTSSLGGEASQEFVARVGGVNGKVDGVVTDTLGNPLAHVVVHLYGTGMMFGMGMMEPEGFFDYSAVTDSTGQYRISHVDVGKYRVRAIPLNQNYLSAWYDSTISVVDTSTHTVDFALENRFHLLPKFAISGSVTDSTGAAVKGAWVVFARAGFVFNEARENQDEWMNQENFRDFFEDAFHSRDVDHRFDLDDLHSPYVFVTYVDSNGAYKDTIPQGHYIIFARAKGYHRTFYNNEFNLLSANILDLTSDTTGINFTLYPIPPVVLGQISGSVADSTTGAAVPARMMAFRDIWSQPDTLKMHVVGAYFTDADSTGAYTFENLPPGNYKILAIPLGGYAPSFYSVSGPTVRWKDATAVQVNGNTVSGVNILVMPLPDSVSGYASISGTVKNSSSHAGVSGAIVYAADGNGNILGYGVTDAMGSYTIVGLAPGSYNLFADVVGYSSSGSSSSSPSYDASGNPISSTSNLLVSPESPAGVVVNKTIQPTSYSLEQNYPNPFNPTTQIAFNIAQTERVNISIFNILGQKVATIINAGMSAGAHVVMWNGRNEHGELLPSGVYFYRLSTPTFSAVKKMILLK